MKRRDDDGGLADRLAPLSSGEHERTRRTADHDVQRAAVDRAARRRDRRPPRARPRPSPSTGRIAEPPSPPSSPRTPATSRHGPSSATRGATTSSATPPTASATTAASTPCGPAAGGARATCAGGSRATEASCAAWPGSAGWPPPSARPTRPSASRCSWPSSTRAPAGPGAERASDDGGRRPVRRPQPADGPRQGAGAGRGRGDGRARRPCPRGRQDADRSSSSAVTPARSAPADGRGSADLHPGEGPVGGVLTALAAVGGDDVLVAACDLPDLDAATVAAMLAAAARNPGAEVVAAETERLEPLLAWWPATSTPARAGALRRRGAGVARGDRRARRRPPARCPPARCATSTGPTDLDPRRAPTAPTCPGT